MSPAVRGAEGAGVGVGGDDGELFDYVEGQVVALQFQARDVIQYESVKIAQQ